jgi:hypothetical protein
MNKDIYLFEQVIIMYNAGRSFGMLLCASEAKPEQCTLDTNLKKIIEGRRQVV